MSDIVIRKNPNWKQIQAGDPVVSDYILRDRTLNFVPFLFSPREGESDRTLCPLGGSLAAEPCWPYGELADRGYENFQGK